MLQDYCKLNCKSAKNGTASGLNIVPWDEEIFQTFSHPHHASLVPGIICSIMHQRLLKIFQCIMPYFILMGFLKHDVVEQDIMRQK